MYPVLMETMAAERVRSFRNEAAAHGRMKLIRSARRSHLTTTATRPAPAPRLIDGGGRSYAPAEPATHATQSWQRAAA
jgi:hypothetical protein